MTSHEIIALRCPSCGSGPSEPSREMPFGAEFRCDHCGVRSVLIIDRALVPLSTLQKQGEKVCITCGRVALREARFCQEGHALVRRCNYDNCGQEFPVDHQRCDFCGGLQDAPRFETSSLNGTFHRAPRPGAPPFVDVGTRVKQRQVLYIIEAMNSMIECECAYDGEVVAIYVDDAQEVQYGDRLFAIKPF